MNNNEYDPNAALFGNDEEIPEEERLFKQLFGKNPRRVSALSDLVYEDLEEMMKSDEIPEEGKMKFLFKMAVNSILDIIMESSPDDVAEEMSYALDSYLGVALTNQKYGVDLFKEQRKAILSVDPKKFENNEQYELALEAFEEEWWSIPQPLLEKRNPNDAITESMRKYGLLE